jgi:poly-beta-hydroxybutyrate-responsive repressor
MARSNKEKTFHPTGDMLTAHLLAMLRDWSAHGFDLTRRLQQEGLGSYNTGTIYRALRQMEEIGLVSSMWDTSTQGPARRIYTLTKAGSLFLKNWISVLDTQRKILRRMMNLPAAEAGSDAETPAESAPRKSRKSRKRKAE